MSSSAASNEPVQRGMDTIHLRTSRLRFVLVMFPCVLAGTFIAGWPMLGLTNVFDFWPHFFAQWIGLSIGTCLLPLRRYDIVLAGNRLQAPARQGLILRPVTVDIANLDIARSRIRWFWNSYLVTRHGTKLILLPQLHSVKATRELVETIRERLA